MRLLIALGATFLSSAFCFSTPVFAMKGGSTDPRPGSPAVIGIKECSAVVIHPRVLVTAAHCANYLNKGWGNQVYFHNRRGPSDLDIKEIYKHPGFVEDYVEENKLQINNDIAVVTLGTPITDAKILAALPRLATTADLKTVASETVAATGMGYRQLHTGKDNPYLGDSSNFERATVDYKVNKIQSSVLFLETKISGSGVCFADSGGAIILEKSGEAVLIGVITTVSTTSKNSCALKGETSYAESIAHQLTFIRDSARKDGIVLK